MNERESMDVEAIQSISKRFLNDIWKALECKKGY